MFSDKLKKVIIYIRKQEVLAVKEQQEYIIISYFDGEYKTLKIVYNKDIYSWVCMRLKPKMISNFGRKVEISTKYKNKVLTIDEQYDNILIKDK